MCRRDACTTRGFGVSLVVQNRCKALGLAKDAGGALHHKGLGVGFVVQPSRLHNEMNGTGTRLSDARGYGYTGG
jgi:hypothetical protein